MLEFSGHKLILFGLAALAFVSYCIYFDYKRCKDPQYRRKVHERRQMMEIPQTANCKLPLNAEVVEYFLRHVYLGEAYVRRDDWDRAVHYFANAIMICADPHILLCKLQTAVPLELYRRIMNRVRLLVRTSDNWSKLSSSMAETYTTSPERTLDKTSSRTSCIRDCSQDN